MTNAIILFTALFGVLFAAAGTLALATVRRGRTTQPGLWLYVGLWMVSFAPAAILGVTTVVF